MSLALNTVVWNEALRIRGLLDHAAKFCDELIVVDQSSDDGTADLARDFGATVVIDQWRGFCEPSRPIAAEHTRSDWILCLDGDEQIAPQFVCRFPFDEFWLGAKLPVASYVDGERIDPRKVSRVASLNGHYKLNAQLRYFRRGAVTYGLGLHTRIEPNFGEDRLFQPQDEGWIVNFKSQVEWIHDDERYKVLAEVGD